MKKLLLIITLFIVSCTPEVSIPTDRSSIPESNAITYTGYYIYSLQINEDGTYRLAYWVTDREIKVHVRIPISNILIERGKRSDIAFVQFNNSQESGKFVIYLTNDFSIGKFYN